MGIYEKLKNIFKDDEVREQTDIPSAQNLHEFLVEKPEDDKFNDYVPYIHEKQHAYIRGIQSIVFSIPSKTTKKINSVEITMKGNRNAYVFFSYDANESCLRNIHMDDGYINKDNGYIESKIDDDKLFLIWHIGSGVTLGYYDVEMTTIKKDGIRYSIKDNFNIYENNEKQRLFERVKTAWGYDRKREEPLSSSPAPA